MRHTPGVGSVARGGLALLAGAFLLAACGSSSPSSTGTSSTSTTAVAAPGQGGVVTWAEPPSGIPNFLFPMNSAYFSTVDIQPQEMMYRPLYWFGTGSAPTLNLAKSVGLNPVYNSTDTAVTVTIPSKWTWSNGEPVNAGDILLWMNMLRIEAPPAPNPKDNYGGAWGDYAAGFFPQNVKSMTVNSPTTVTFNLTTAVNPYWFNYNELSEITPLPQSWDVTSLTGAPGSGGCSMTAYTAATQAQCIAVFTFLTKQAGIQSTYVGSPIWSVVDGPWTLKSFDTTTGDIDFVPNTKYTGGPKPYLSGFDMLGFTTDTAEYNVLKAGNTIDVGYIPPQDLPANPSGSAFSGPNASAVSSKYNLDIAYLYQYNYWVPNLENPTVGAIFRQLYAREAVQDLQNQELWIKAYDDGYAIPTYGPVPTVPSTWTSPAESTDPFPYSPSAASALLKANGWTVVPGGVSTCTKPGSGAGECGAGITAGQKFEFTLVWATGAAAFESQMVNLAAAEDQGAGIKINLVGQLFNTIIGSDYYPCEEDNACSKFEAADWGGGWVYSPDYLPTGEPLFFCKGTNPDTAPSADSSSYCNDTNNNLIILSTKSSGKQPIFNYENFLSKQLPVFYQPAPGILAEVIDHLYIGPINVFDTLNPEDWYWQKGFVPAS
jgi:peptide/nickel transport system substrate-binding protein